MRTLSLTGHVFPHGQACAEQRLRGKDKMDTVQYEPVPPIPPLRSALLSPKFSEASILMALRSHQIASALLLIHRGLGGSTFLLP
jgi:hypothetical protein